MRKHLVSKNHKDFFDRENTQANTNICVASETLRLEQKLYFCYDKVRTASRDAAVKTKRF